MKLFCYGIFLAGMWGGAANGFEIRDVSPITGSAQDTTITIRGRDFDPDQTYLMTVDGQAAQVLTVTTDQIIAKLASTTTSGLIKVSDGGNEITALEPFVVTRLVNGVFRSPSRISPSGYKVLAYQSLLDPVLNEGTGAYEFSMQVPLDDPTFLWAIRGENDPVFVGVVDSSDNIAVVDVASTAVGLALMNPALMAREDEIVQLYRALILEKDLAVGMKNFLNQEMREGESFLFNPEYQSLMGELIVNLLNERSSSITAAKQGLPPSSTPPSNTLIHSLNKEFLFSEITTKLSLTPAFFKHPDDYTLKFEGGSRFSSLDWVIEIFRLRNSAFDFENGLEDVKKLTWEDTPTLASTRAVDEAFVAAKLDTARVNYIGNLVSWVIKQSTDLVSTESNELGPNEVALSAGKPDIYLVQAYSGNVFWRYGGQEYVLDDFDPNHGWLISLSNNAIILVVDSASMFIDFKKLTGVDDLGFVTSQYKSLQKAFSVALVDGEMSKG
ncbi:MAG TPA: hypothetical protein EYQ50_17235 [Verrucomicrobiales bacterium]|nr:hypothetical protein [Verrucomicrobiales bacterium]HIL72042.1 hypothetical protein [Verrucomicrobiota bacterium]